MNTTYFLQLVAGNIFHSKPTPSVPTIYYIGLSKTEPNIQGTHVTEPSGGGYARVAIRGSDLTEPTTSGRITNINTIVFPEATGSWGTVTHYVIYDAAAGGHLLMYGALMEPCAVSNGADVAFRVGALTLTVANQT